MKAYRVTLHLEEAFKHQSDRMWNALMALDVLVLEEHQKAGVIIAETFHPQLELLEHVPGVLSVHVTPVEEKIYPTPLKFARR